MPELPEVETVRKRLLKRLKNRKIKSINILYDNIFEGQKEYVEKNPLKVLESVYDIIKERKAHPQDGSYTNYLFGKGTDKILQKLGEECTEIVIAAKNPEPENIKYEISDFLYHMMVLMVEKGVSWEEITEELDKR